MIKSKSYWFVIFVLLIFLGLGFFGCEEEEKQNEDQGITPQESFQKIISDLLSKWNIPGAAIALVKDDRLVLAQGYGQADKENNQHVTAVSLFRIASLSKPITAVTVLKLFEDGLLDLDEKVFSILSDLHPPESSIVDPRLYDITVRDLLRHSGGWDKEVSFVPMFRSREIAEAMGVQSPPSSEIIIRYMMGQQLDFSPGERYAYSNFGYCVLGRVIERVTGENYESYTRTNVLKPMGISCMSIGHTLLEDRAKNEVRYYDYPGAPLALPVFLEFPQLVEWPYGGFYLEAMDANGGWIASVVDLMRFITAVDGHTGRSDLLQLATIELMVSRPELSDWKNSDYYYGLGWLVRPIGSEANWWHTGSLPGTATILVRTYHGLAWAALFNSWPFDQNTFMSELDNALWQAVNGITAWPSFDLFENYPNLALDQELSPSYIYREYERTEIKRKLLHDLPLLIREAKIRHKLVKGRPSGLEITKLPRECIIFDLGFRRNDIISEINGKPLNSLGILFALYCMLESENRIEVKLERNRYHICMVFILS